MRERTLVETEEIKNFEEYIKQSFTRNSLPVERCSEVLFSQLAHMPQYGGMNHPFQFVEREIIHLEGRGETETKPATAFRRGKLKGFMHKHFFVPGYEHIGMNTKITWEFDLPGSKKFTEMALRLAKPYATDGENTHEELCKFSDEIANEIINGAGGLKDRFASEEGTGDWIVYIPHDGKNYYLCIAKHGEDDFIWTAMTHSIPEFPFLESILSTK